jgi:hypothetical protein
MKLTSQERFSAFLSHILLKRASQETSPGLRGLRSAILLCGSLLRLSAPQEELDFDIYSLIAGIKAQEIICL